MLAIGLGVVAAQSAQILGALTRAEVDGVFWRGPGLPPGLPIALPVVEARGPHGKRGLASLVSEDRDERDAARDALWQLFDWAVGIGGTTVVVRLPAPRRFAPLWEEVRDGHLRGALDAGARTERLVQRGAELEPTLDRARAILDKILDQAERCRCRVALVNPGRYLDLPAPHEAEALRAEFEGGPLELWFDGPAAHLADTMGVFPRDWTKRVFDTSEGHAGCFVGDACGPIGALAPGRGALFGELPQWIGRGATRVFSPWNGLTIDEAIASYQAMRSWLQK